MNLQLLLLNKIPQKYQAVAWRFLCYNGVGLVGTALYIACNIFLVSVIHLAPVISVIIAFIINVIFNYLLNSLWVFKKQHSQNHTQTSLRFLTVSLVGLLLNTGIMYLTVNILKLWYFYGIIFAAFIVPGTNFILHNFWSFKPTTKTNNSSLP